MTETKEQKEIEYTKKDLEELKRLCSQSFAAILDNIDCDPQKFKDLMKRMPKKYRYVYQKSMIDIISPENLLDPTTKGFQTWRLKIGK